MPLSPGWSDLGGPEKDAALKALRLQLAAHASAVRGRARGTMHSDSLPIICAGQLFTTASRRVVRSCRLRTEPVPTTEEHQYNCPPVRILNTVHHHLTIYSLRPRNSRYVVFIAALEKSRVLRKIQLFRTPRHAVQRCGGFIVRWECSYNEPRQAAKKY